MYKKSFPSSTRCLEEMRRFVESCCAEAQLSADTVEQFKLAVDEACTNVIKHAYKGSDAQRIDISVIVKPDRFTVRIRDKGDQFRPADYHSPDLFDSVRRRRPGGFGVHIMRRVMDQIEYRTKGHINEVCLTKFLNGGGCNGGSGKGERE
ncbi:MAG TPA: ATP-binding protein [Rhodothermales bacterium]|nr:ATP-binding protein [Rhodothermales bacterium]